jgi:hypothetical protein
MNNQLQAIQIDSIVIRQDSEGRYCLNDLHKAAGGLTKDSPSNWDRRDRIEPLLEELKNSSIWKGIAFITSVGGRNGGTFVCKELVYAYAMWISPKFHLKVIRAYDSMVTQSKQTTPALPNFTDPAEAAIAWATQYRAAQEASQQLALAAPKVERYEDLMETDGLLNIKQAASKVGMTSQQLGKFLQCGDGTSRLTLAARAELSDAETLSL